MLPAHNPGEHAPRFGLFPVRSPLLRKSLFNFSSCGYLDVSVPRVPSCKTMYSSYGDSLFGCRVSPFGCLRINACLRLPVAFRSLPRPSSALGALASALCSCSLDFLENDLSIIVDPETNCLIYFPVNCYQYFLQLVF